MWVCGPYLQVGYCENDVDCRRTLQLAHFGELSFNAAHCKGTCDNCARRAKVVEEDMSGVAKQLVRHSRVPKAFRSASDYLDG